MWRFFALLAFTTACASTTEAESRLEIQVEITRPQVSSGDTLSIVVTAFNPTDRPIRLPQGPCMPLMYRVYAPDGERIAPSPTTRCSIVNGDGTLTVEPGKSQSVVHRWAAIVGYGTTQPGAGVPLPPGEYTVVGGVAGEPRLQSPSAPVKLQVVAP